jgi:hypothetical protein
MSLVVTSRSDNIGSILLASQSQGRLLGLKPSGPWAHLQGPIHIKLMPGVEARVRQHEFQRLKRLATRCYIYKSAKNVTPFMAD